MSIVNKIYNFFFKDPDKKPWLVASVTPKEEKKQGQIYTETQPVQKQTPTVSADSHWSLNPHKSLSSYFLDPYQTVAIAGKGPSPEEEQETKKLIEQFTSFEKKVLEPASLKTIMSTLEQLTVQVALLKEHLATQNEVIGNLYEGNLYIAHILEHLAGVQEESDDDSVSVIEEDMNSEGEEVSEEEERLTESPVDKAKREMAKKFGAN